MLIPQLVAKFASFFSRRVLKRGGETWPGELVLKLHLGSAESIRQRFKSIILVVGTNGKTSTAKILADCLRLASREVVHNASGANLLNGIVSTALVQLPLVPKKEKPVAVFEVDEYALPQIVEAVKPDQILILNVFRDQLDRYGEVANILDRWKVALAKSEAEITYLASDPALAYLLLPLKLNKRAYLIPPSLLANSSGQVFGDFNYCGKCGAKLKYRRYYLAQLGDWFCSECGTLPDKKAFMFNPQQLNKLEKFPGYMQINLEGVKLLQEALGLPEVAFWASVANWQPAFGRGETVEMGGQSLSFFLGKNPASWTAALNALAAQLKPTDSLVLGLNNRIPDGHDVSWIWDVEIAKLPQVKLSFFGDRGLDMAVRFKADGHKSGPIYASLFQMKSALAKSHGRVFFLSNYSAMLELRKLYFGRAI